MWNRGLNCGERCVVSGYSGSGYSGFHRKKFLKILAQFVVKLQKYVVIQL